MDTFTLAMITVGISTNLACFLFGMVVGRNSAYKAVGPAAIADTVQDMSKISSSP